MLGHHHKFRDYDEMVSSLMETRRRGTMDEEQLNQVDYEEDNPRIVEFNEYMGNEKLSPLEE